MLPRTNCCGVTNEKGQSLGKRPDCIGHESILSPVATSDHIAGPPSCHKRRPIPAEEAAAIRVSYQLRTSLTVAVRIVAAELIHLSITPRPVQVLIDLVAGNDDHGLDGWLLAHGLKQVDRPHHIGGVGFDRRGIGSSHKSLSRHVDDHGWLRLT
jgi:hypothetical protein